VGKVRLEIEGINAVYAVDKLSKAGIAVISAQKTQKNGVLVEVAANEWKKAFAILQSSCYNVKKVGFRGLSLFRKKAVARAGLIAGAILFLLAVPFLQSRILRIDVTGSGAYLKAEVGEILARNGYLPFRALPEDPSQATAEILSLPRVSFCSVKKSGGIVTVDVEVSDGENVLVGQPMKSSVAGVVRRVVAVRGCPCVKEGDEVKIGDILVSSDFEGRNVVVIASVELDVPFSAFYAAADEEAAELAAGLEFGEIGNISIERREDGFLVTGSRIVTVSQNMI